MSHTGDTLSSSEVIVGAKFAPLWESFPEVIFTDLSGRIVLASEATGKVLTGGGPVHCALGRRTGLRARRSGTGAMFYFTLGEQGHGNSA